MQFSNLGQKPPAPGVLIARLVRILALFPMTPKHLLRLANKPRCLRDVLPELPLAILNLQSLSGSACGAVLWRGHYSGILPPACAMTSSH